MIKPIRIQRSRQHKQTSPNGLPIIYVGRPSKYKNPFPISAQISRGASMELYREYIDSFDPEEIKRDLNGKNLSCWCKLTDKCHADILLQISNG